MKKIISLVFVLFSLTACSSLFPTTQPSPTALPPSVTWTKTIAPTPSTTLTVTQAENGQRVCLTVHSLAVRSGPGLNYGKAGYLLKGDCVILTGRDKRSAWVKIDRGWVYAYYFEDLDLDQLPVVNAKGETATAIPSATEPKPTATRTPKPTTTPTLTKTPRPDSTITPSPEIVLT